MRQLTSGRELEVRRLSPMQRVGYASGNFGKNILANTLAFFILFYATDVLGIDAATAGAIILAATLWGAALDPLIGMAADRTRSKLGKYGPYIVFGAPLASASLVLVFLVPTVMPHPGVSLAVLLCAFFFFYAAIDLPHNALMARVSIDSRERSQIATGRFFFSSLGSLSVALGAYGIFFKDDNGAQTERFIAFAAIASLLSLVVMWISWLSVARNDQSAPYTAYRFREQLVGARRFITDRDGLVVLAVAFFSGATFPLFVRALPYYCKYNLDEVGLVPYAVTALVLGQLVSIPVWMHLAVRYEKSLALSFAHGFGILAFIAFLLMPLLHTTGFLTSVFSVGVAGGGVWSIIWAMTPDVADKVEAHGGIRSEAVTFSLASESMKIGIALGAGLMGVLLTAVGFQAELVQTAETLFGIKAIMTVPAILGSGAAIACLAAYRLTHEAHLRLIPGCAGDKDS